MSIDIKEIAQQYIDKGYQVVPLVKGEKRATDSWRAKVYEPTHFKDGDGIALKCGEPSGWLVDVDLDCPEALAVADEFLPNSAMVHGRQAKPSSHRWFICKDIKSTPFTDVKPDGSKGLGPMLVEIRSTGGYTAVPPSLNPNNGQPEPLQWVSDGTPMSIEPDVLYAAVRDLALTALIARHWNEFGHAGTGPLAGFLCRAGVRDVVNVIKHAATVAGAPSHIVKDATTYAKDTVGKFNAKERVAGGPTLEQHLSVDLINKMRGWCKAGDGDDAIEDMNSTHFVVRMGKDAVIGREDDPDGVIFQVPKALNIEYANQHIMIADPNSGDLKSVPLFKAWLASKQRRDYRKVVFCPPPLKADPRDFDLWRGFNVNPPTEVALISASEMQAFMHGQHVPGQCFRILQHIREIICNDDPIHYAYLMNLLAHTVQFPGQQLGICVVMRGPEGGGKGVFVEYLGRLFHPHHYAHLTKMDQAIGRFNKTIMAKIIIYLDEAAAQDAHKNIGTFKSLITDPTIQIEPKGIDSEAVANLSHIFVSTNEEWSVPVPEETRRFFFLRVSDRYAYGHCASDMRKAYFDPLFAELEDPASRAAFLYHLKRRDISTFDRFAKPITAEEQEQRLKSLRGPIRWLFDVLESGEFFKTPTTFGGALPWPTGDVKASDVYSAYETWCKQRGEKAWDPPVWGQKVARYIWVGGKTRSHNNQRVGQLVSPAELRKALPPLTEFKAESITVIPSKQDESELIEVERILDAG